MKRLTQQHILKHHEKLKPCPFCNSDAVLIEKSEISYNAEREYIGYDIRCTNEECYLSGGADYWLESEEHIIKLWNTRVEVNYND